MDAATAAMDIAKMFPVVAKTRKNRISNAVSAKSKNKSED